jgi:hypothetical protein
MAYTTEERIAHVYRRPDMGAYPDLVATTSSIDEAISRALDLDQPSPDLLEMEIPLGRDDAMDIAKLAEPVQTWITSMVKSARLIEGRLVWSGTTTLLPRSRRFAFPICSGDSISP